MTLHFSDRVFSAAFYEAANQPASISPPPRCGLAVNSAEAVSSQPKHLKVSSSCWYLLSRLVPHCPTPSAVQPSSLWKASAAEGGTNSF